MNFIRSGWGIVVILVLAGITAGAIYYGFQIWSRPEEVTPPKAKLPEERVRLYFYDPGQASLILVKRKVPEANTTSDRIRQVFQEMKNVPSDQSERLISLVPNDLKLRSVFIGDQIIYLDFGDKITTLKPGLNEERMLLYSIVNTILVNAPDEKKLVHFLVEGETRKTIGPYGQESGHISIRYPLGPRWNLAKSQ